MNMIPGWSGYGFNSNIGGLFFNWVDGEWRKSPDCQWCILMKKMDLIVAQARDKLVTK